MAFLFYNLRAGVYKTVTFDGVCVFVMFKALSYLLKHAEHTDAPFDACRLWHEQPSEVLQFGQIELILLLVLLVSL